MRALLLVPLLLQLISSALAEIKTEDEVLVLEKANFKEAVEGNDFVLVEFYAPWCGHCKKLAPEYADAAKKLKAKDSPFKLAKVDATVEKDLAKDHEVKGYPTLIYYKKGEKEKYTGGRTSKDIVKWLEKNGGADLPPKEIPVLSDVAAAKAFAAKAQDSDVDDPVVALLGVFKDLQGEEAAAFRELAKTEVEDDFAMALASGGEFLKEFGASEGVDDNAVFVFKPFDDKVAAIEKDFRLKRLQIQAYKNFFPYLAVANKRNYDASLREPKLGRERVYIFKSELTDEETTALTKLCKNTQDRAQCLHVDSKNTDARASQQLAKQFGVTSGNDLVMRMTKVGKDGKPKKYKPEEEPLELTKAKWDEFLGHVFLDVMEPYLLSEAVPEDWDKEPVKVLVGENFNKVAKDLTKDVLVEFYAPWCGHCKKLAPIYDDLGEKFKDSEDVIIAKMDATANEAEGVEIRGFPTIKFFPKGSDKVVDFKGERTVDGFAEFIEANAGKLGGHEEL